MAEARAPGKLVLSGEYAVLHGAPAIAAAVAAEAVATVMPARECRLEVAGVGAWPFVWRPDGLPGWLGEQPGAPGATLEAVAGVLVEAGVKLRAVAVMLDTRAFSVVHADGRSDKLGLGSSAAIVASLVHACCCAAGVAADPARLFSLSVAAHQRLQGGGSGIDIAVAVHGGVVAMRGSGPSAQVSPLPWPAGLRALAVWSGQSASTPSLLSRFIAFEHSDAERFATLIAALRARAEAVLAAWRTRSGSDPAPAVLAALDAYAQALQHLDEVAGIGIVTPVHAALAAEARSIGACYKTSGAGGGDFGLAFATEPAVIAALATRWRDAGRIILPINAGTVHSFP